MSMQVIFSATSRKNKKGMANHMKNQRKAVSARPFAIIVAIVIVCAITVLPALALEMGGMTGMRHGNRGRAGETADPPPHR